MYTFRLWVLMAVLLASSSARSATLSGRLTTSAYSWQGRELSGSDVRHLRLYQTAVLNAGRLGGGQALSLHAHAQFTGDVLDEVSGREHYRIYSAYAKLRPGKFGLDVRLGRQRIYGGVGFGTIDGARAQAAPRRWIELTGYAGILTPLIPDDGIGTWDEGHMWGGQALVDVKKTVLTVSYAERSRAPLAYLGAGRYSQLTIGQNAAQFRRLGLDARRDWPQGSLYGRLDLDAEEWEIQELEIAGELQVAPRLRLSAEFEHRRPTLYLNSILSVFEVENNQEIEGRVTYQINDRVRVLGRVSRVAYDGDDSWDVGAGLLLGNGYLGYTRRIGYGGSNDAITASFQQPLNEQVSLRADGSVSSYRLYDGQIKRDRALAGMLGLRYQARRTLHFDVEAQVLRNAFYNRDARVFARASFWFFKRQPQGRTQR